MLKFPGGSHTQAEMYLSNQKVILWQKGILMSDDVSAAIEAIPCMLKHTPIKTPRRFSGLVLRCVAVLLLTVAASLPGQLAPLSAATKATESAPKYDIVVFKDVMVRMRDGVKLACTSRAEWQAG
jgi:hypothetical protein